MKKLLVLLTSLFIFAGVSYAAPKAEKKVSTVVFTTDIDCPHCSKKITDNIPLEKGVLDVTVDVPTKTATVTFDANKTSVDKLIKAFTSIRVKVFKTVEKK